jgi:hypothetical protein
MVENADYAAMLSRMIRSYRKRIAAGDVEDLADIARLIDELTDAMSAAIDEGRDHDPEGWSWTHVGRVLGITRQAAQQRFGR